MPIVGNPIATAPTGTAVPAIQEQANVGATLVFGEPAIERTRALVVRDGGLPTVNWIMTDRAGTSVDLTGALVGGSVPVVLRLGEATDPMRVRAFPGIATDVAGGQVAAAVDLVALGGPGIFQAEFAVLDAQGAVVFTNPFSLVVEPSLFSGTTLAGPPSLAEIRLALRDSSPVEHRLIDTVTFDDAEIALAIRRPVEYWNEALPPVGPWYSTANFPYRFHWTLAASAVLFRMLAEYYRKNHLQYQAGGIAVDDLGKSQEYDQQADALWGRYEAFVRSKKMALNLEGCWGTVGSDYGGSWVSDRW